MADSFVVLSHNGKEKPIGVMVGKLECMLADMPVHMSFHLSTTAFEQPKRTRRAAGQTQQDREGLHTFRCALAHTHISMRAHAHLNTQTHSNTRTLSFVSLVSHARLTHTRPSQLVFRRGDVVEYKKLKPGEQQELAAVYGVVYADAVPGDN